MQFYEAMSECDRKWYSLGVVECHHWCEAHRCGIPPASNRAEFAPSRCRVVSSDHMKRDFAVALLNPNVLAYRMFGLYSFLYPRFRRRIQLVGKSRLRMHPLTSLVLANSEIVIENGVLRLGMDFIFLDASSLAGAGYDLRRDNCRLHLYNSVLHTVGDVCLLPGCRVIAVNSKVVIRNGTIINGPTYIIARRGVHIGEDCILARGVTVMDSDMHRIGGTGRKSTEEDIKEVVIGNHCWIGQNATILKGVVVGDGAIVAANSVVTEDVKGNNLVAGIPAKVIREGVIWE
jgi:acetyltransferase-like isoleucine patch superfamily enzyme